MKTYTSHFIERVRCRKLLGFLQVILRHVEVSLCSYILPCEMRHFAGFVVSLSRYDCQPCIAHVCRAYSLTSVFSPRTPPVVAATGLSACSDMTAASEPLSISPRLLPQPNKRQIAEPDGEHLQDEAREGTELFGGRADFMSLLGLCSTSVSHKLASAVGLRQELESGLKLNCSQHKRLEPQEGLIR